MKRIALLALIVAIVAGIVLYAARPDSANAPVAETPAPAMAEDGLRKLVVHSSPKPVPDVPLAGPDGTSLSLSDLQGKLVVLNFWATWCAPCREEMPSLNTLQKAHGGEDFEVIVLATGRNAPAAIDRFFDEQQIDALVPYRDPDMALARQMAVLGLPVTVILGRDGQEIARLTGDADWAGAEALASLAALGLQTN